MNSAKLLFRASLHLIKSLGFFFAFTNEKGYMITIKECFTVTSFHLSILRWAKSPRYQCKRSFFAKNNPIRQWIIERGIIYATIFCNEVTTRWNELTRYPSNSWQHAQEHDVIFLCYSTRRAKLWWCGAVEQLTRPTNVRHAQTLASLKSGCRGFLFDNE